MAAAAVSPGLLALNQGCSAPGAAPPNVVIAVFDSMRSDHLGCYGYARPTSPFMDSLAKQGIVFENAFAQSSFTRESVASIFTGNLPSSCGAMGWGARPQRGRTLASLFKEQGYRTGFFSETVMLTDPAFTVDFDEVRHPTEQDLSGGGPALAQAASTFATAPSNEPYFAYVHFMDPHAPYEPPEEFYLKFASSIMKDRLNLVKQVRSNIPGLKAEGFGPGEVRFDDLVNRYDAEIAHSDFSLRLLIDSLEKAGKLDNTLVVVTSDHGEEFLDHDFVEHSWMLYREHVQVPLIFWWPRKLKPAMYLQRVGLQQLAPTVASLAGFSDLGAFPAQSLLTPKGAFLPPSDTPIYSELMIQSRNIVRTIREGEWMYVGAQRWTDRENLSELALSAGDQEKQIQRGELPKTDVFGPIVHEELYHLPSDPNEQIDLAKRELAVTEQFRNMLTAFCDQQRATAPVIDPVEIPENKENREQLEDIGYL